MKRKQQPCMIHYTFILQQYYCNNNSNKNSNNNNHNNRTLNDLSSVHMLQIQRTHVTESAVRECVCVFFLLLLLLLQFDRCLATVESRWNIDFGRCTLQLASTV